MAEDRSALARFGGKWGWVLDDPEGGLKLNVGAAIAGEGPGQGFGMLPWALDHYERVLRLAPGESWLLKRMLTRAWTHGGLVFLSMRKISFEACVTRPTLQAYVKKLSKLGYIREVSRGAGQDHRIRYDVSGLYGALALCIAADPHSEWAKVHGPLSAQKAASLTHSLPLGQNGNGSKKHKAVYFDLDFNALRALVERGGNHE